jgi:hypothetical protein
LLLPSTSNVVTAPRLQQLHNLKDIDWAHLVFKELQDALLLFKKPKIYVWLCGFIAGCFG